jgi:hypothetical protein
MQHNLVPLADQKPRLHEAETVGRTGNEYSRHAPLQGSGLFCCTLLFLQPSADRRPMDRQVPRKLALMVTVFFHRFMQLLFQLPLIVPYWIGQELWQVRPC